MRLANVSLEEYLLLRFLRGENCHQDDISEVERQLLFEWAHIVPIHLGEMILVNLTRVGIQ